VRGFDSGPTLYLADEAGGGLVDDGGAQDHLDVGDTEGCKCGRTGQ
jgi:hypothetical protein